MYIKTKEVREMALIEKLEIAWDNGDWEEVQAILDEMDKEENK